MQMTAVYSCVRILAEAIAGLPLHVYHQEADGAKVKAFDHPLYRLLHDEPNPEMTSFIFRETLMTHLLLWGNAFAQVFRNGRDEVIGLYPLMPNRMTVVVTNKVACIMSISAAGMNPQAGSKPLGSLLMRCCIFQGWALTVWLGIARLRWPRTPSA